MESPPKWALSSSMSEDGWVYNLMYDISLMYDKQVAPHLQVWHKKAGSSLHDSTVCIIQRKPHVIFVCLNRKVRRLQAGTEHTSWSLTKGCVCAPQLWTAAPHSTLLFQKTPKNTHRLPPTMKEFPRRFHLGIRHVFAWLSHFPNLMRGIKSTNAVETHYNFTCNLWEEGKNETMDTIRQGVNQKQNWREIQNVSSQGTNRTPSSSFLWYQSFHFCGNELSFWCQLSVLNELNPKDFPQSYWRSRGNGSTL